MRDPGSISTAGNIFHWIFCFHVVKFMMPIFALSPFLCISKKLYWRFSFLGLSNRSNSITASFVIVIDRCIYF